MSKKITDYMEVKKKTTVTSVELDEDLLMELKNKLKAKGQTLRSFYEASAKKYLDEK